MKYFLSLLVICVLISEILFSTMLFALKEMNPRSSSDRGGKQQEISYPVGDDFIRLQSLIEESFSPGGNNSSYNCIANKTLCPNYRYTSITEKAIKFIVMKTYNGNETFYKDLFGDSEDTLSQILGKIPKGNSVSDWKKLGFGNSFAGDLLDASFGVDFTEHANSNTMLGAIEQKITEMKRRKCQEVNKSPGSFTSSNCPWNGEISNIYLPTPEELGKETIYLNRRNIGIKDILGSEIEFTVNYTEADIGNEGVVNIFPIDYILSFIPETTTKYSTIREKLIFLSSVGNNESMLGEYKTTATSILSLIEHDESISSKGKLEIKNQLMRYIPVQKYQSKEGEKISESYTLKYIKTSFNLQEAKDFLTEGASNSALGDGVYTPNSPPSMSLPCGSGSNSSIKRSQCISATTDLRIMSSALVAYYVDTMTYPSDLQDVFVKGYIPNSVPLSQFLKNFSYKPTKDTAGNPSFEIRYIGSLDNESVNKNKTDYKSLLSGATVPEIPNIFAHVPHEDMVLYVKNPQQLFTLLEEDKDVKEKLSGIDIAGNIRKFVMSVFELSDFEAFQKNIHNEMVFAVANLDITKPDIVVVLSEADKGALSPTAQARVVGSKDGYIYIASSKESLERYMNLSPDKSLKNADDFHYVWWKKSAMIRDGFVFVGDAFFENLLNFETYIIHYRKYRDYARLWNLQELVWSYADAFGVIPKSLDQIVKMGFSSFDQSILGEYKIQDGLVVHKNIGSIQSVKTLMESRYDLNNITRSELEDYKYNVLKYRDIWRSSLDPMGIVLNRYGDGLEVDFFMTPIPAVLKSGYLKSSIDAYMSSKADTRVDSQYESILKDSFEFLTNPHIRMGITSFVAGFDAKKLRKNLESNAMIQKYFQEFSKEVLDGKNIFDYIGGEFAFSFGGMSPDILDGWNIEKIDLYASVQMISEEKGKELIDIIRARILKEIGSSRGSEEDLIREFLTKPLIEDYASKKIYYVEGLAIPFVGKIGFAYTFIDNFFMIAPNRSTIKKIIDIAESGDESKKRILDAQSIASQSYVAVVVDGKNMSTQIRDLYEANKSSIPRYARMFQSEVSLSQTDITELIGMYYAKQEKNRRFAKNADFSYTLGMLQFLGDTNTVRVKLNSSALSHLTGSLLQTWQALPTDTGAILGMHSASGIELDKLLMDENATMIFSYGFMTHIDQALFQNSHFIKNTTFGVSFGNDEIGFRLRLFGQKDIHPSNVIFGMSKTESFIIFGTIITIVVFGGLGIFFIRRRRGLGSLSTTTFNADNISSEAPTPSAISIISPSGTTNQN